MRARQFLLLLIVLQVVCFVISWRWYTSRHTMDFVREGMTESKGGTSFCRLVAAYSTAQNCVFDHVQPCVCLTPHGAVSRHIFFEAALRQSIVLRRELFNVGISGDGNALGTILVHVPEQLSHVDKKVQITSTRMKLYTFGGFSPEQLDSEVEEDLNTCRDAYTGADTIASQILKSRLLILKEYIPTYYSPKFRSPCWYDSHQEPSSVLLKPKVVGWDCSSTPLSYDPVEAQSVLERVKKPGERHLSCLPAFFLSGFPKCATTSLYEMLVKHPLVLRTVCKESQFWTQFIDQQGSDLDKRMQSLWYINFFSSLTQEVESSPQSMTIDASGRYLVWNTESDFCVLPKLLMRVLPEAKFIVMMRNPSERVFSHYSYFSLHRSSRDVALYSKEAPEIFHNSTVAAIMRFKSCISGGHLISHCVRNKSIDQRSHRNGYVGLQYSMYYYHIVPWLTFIPRERFLFLRTEDLAKNASLTMSNVWRFLDIDDFPETEEVFANENKEVTYLTFLPRTKKLLNDFFQPYNELLAHLLSDTRYLWND